jgi:hypothetical protein
MSNIRLQTLINLFQTTEFIFQIEYLYPNTIYNLVFLFTFLKFQSINENIKLISEIINKPKVHKLFGVLFWIIREQFYVIFCFNLI